MITFDSAKSIALKTIKREGATLEMELTLAEDETLEEDFGWVFFYTSVKWLETNDLKYAIAGNAPFIIDRYTGHLELAGTAHEISHYIKLYRRYGTCHPIEE